MNPIWCKKYQVVHICAKRCQQTLELALCKASNVLAVVSETSGEVCQEKCATLLFGQVQETRDRSDIVKQSHRPKLCELREQLQRVSAQADIALKKELSSLWALLRDAEAVYRVRTRCFARRLWPPIG